MSAQERYAEIKTLAERVVGGHGPSMLEVTRRLKRLAGEDDRELFLDTCVAFLACFDYFVRAEPFYEPQDKQFAENAKIGFDTVLALQSLYCERNGWNDETKWPIFPMSQTVLKHLPN